MTNSPFSRQFRRAGGRNLTQQFGEPVTYRPRAGGTARVIKALVERDPNAMITETGELLGKRIMVIVENSDCRGIGAEEVDTGGDEIELTRRNDRESSTERRPIVRVIDDNGSMLKVLCQ